MNTADNVSFLEIESGVVRLGAGSAQAVLQRSTSTPCVRLYCLEPPRDQVKFRARCGTTTVGPDGFVDAEEPDPMLRLGAWAAMLPLFDATAQVLEQASLNALVDLGADADHHVWLQCAFDPPRAALVSQEMAHATLQERTPAAGKAITLEFAGSKAEIEVMLDLVRGLRSRPWEP